MIGIVNFNLGNIGSITRIINWLGFDSKIISSPNELAGCDKLILPGVGNFSEGMASLGQLGFIEPLRHKVLIESIPILGICLGMQLLCRDSEEGSVQGLGFIDAHVKKFSFSDEQNLKIPHMGWSDVFTTQPNAILPILPHQNRFYFVHSYYVTSNDPTIIIGSSDHGGKFCSAFNKKNIFGVQFHPEKSHTFGKALMKNFLEL